MILDLTVAAAREQAKAVVCAQGTFSILVRSGEALGSTRWSVADVLAYLDLAERIERRGSVVTTQLRGDYTRHFYLPEFASDQDDEDGAGVVWEVDDAAGAVVYRGRDLELAHELAQTKTGAHLIARAVPA